MCHRLCFFSVLFCSNVKIYSIVALLDSPRYTGVVLLLHFNIPFLPGSRERETYVVIYT